MGVLDELKKEAATVKAKVERSRSDEQTQRDAVLRELRPRMQALYAFLKELADNLAVVNPDVRVAYEVGGFGQLKGLRQEGYRVSTPDNRALSHFTLHFNCVSAGTVRFQVKGKEAAERQRQAMWQNNLRFTSKALSDGTGVFHLETHIPVTLEFETDVERGNVRMRERNLEVLGSNTIYYDPEQLTEDFFDELGKAVLRQPNRFSELSGNTLSEDARRRLRQQLAHDGLRRLSEKAAKEAPAASAVAPAPPTTPSPEKKGLLKGLLRRG